LTVYTLFIFPQIPVKIQTNHLTEYKKGNYCTYTVK